MAKKDIKTEDLLKKYEEEKKNRKAEKTNKERFTGDELFDMKNAIAGFELSPNGEFRRKSGIGDLKGKEHAVFKTKITRNLQIIENELEIARSLLPEIPKEEKQKFKEFNEKKSELIENNIGTEASERMDLTPIEKIRLSGNIKIYEAGLEELREQYKSTINTVKEVEEIADEIFQKPICKCDFDLILEEEIPPEVSPNERREIWPMIKMKSTNKPQKEE